MQLIACPYRNCAFERRMSNNNDDDDDKFICVFNICEKYINQMRCTEAIDNSNEKKNRVYPHIKPYKYFIFVFFQNRVKWQPFQEIFKRVQMQRPFSTIAIVIVTTK